MKGETNNKRQAKLLAAVAVMAMVVCALAVAMPSSDAASTPISGATDWGSGSTVDNSGVYKVTSDTTITLTSEFASLETATIYLKDGVTLTLKGANGVGGALTVYPMNAAGDSYEGDVSMAITAMTAGQVSITAKYDSATTTNSTLTVSGTVTASTTTVNSVLVGSGNLVVSQAAFSDLSIGAMVVFDDDKDTSTYYGGNISPSLDASDIVVIRSGTSAVSVGSNEAQITVTTGSVQVKNNAGTAEITNNLTAGSITIQSGEFKSINDTTTGLNAVTDSAIAVNKIMKSQISDGYGYIYGSIIQKTDVDNIAITFTSNAILTIDEGVTVKPTDVTGATDAVINLYGTFAATTSITVGEALKVNVANGGYLSNISGSSLTIKYLGEEGEYAFGNVLDQDESITSSRYLTSNLVIPSGYTLTITSNGSLNLNGFSILVQGQLVIDANGFVSAIGVADANNASKFEGIILSNTGAITNNGLIGNGNPVEITAVVTGDDTSGLGGTVGTTKNISNWFSQVSAPTYTGYGTVSVQNVMGVSFGLKNTGNTTTPARTLTVTGDMSATGPSNNNVTIDGAYIVGTATVGDMVAMTVSSASKLDMNADLVIDGSLAAGSNLLEMLTGSSITLNGSATGVVTADTGEKVSNDVTGAFDGTATPFKFGGNVTGLIITVSSYEKAKDVDGISTLYTYQNIYISGTLDKIDDSSTVAADNNKIGTELKNYFIAEGSVLAVTDGITVDGTVTVQGELQMVGPSQVSYVGTMYTVTDSADKTKKTYFVKPFDAAFDDIEKADNKTLEMKGETYEIPQDMTILNGYTIKISNANLNIDEAATVTVEKGATITGKINTVDGMLVVIDGAGCSAPNVYEVKKIGNGTTVYAGIVAAINNASSGDVINVNYGKTVENSMTIPAGVTVNVASGVNLVFNGDLVIEETAKVVNKGSITMAGEKSKLTVNGDLDSKEGTVGFGVNATQGQFTSTGKTVITGTIDKANAAYYSDAEGYRVYTTVAKAAQAVAAKDSGKTVNIIGNVSENADIALDGVNLTIDANAKVVLGNVTIDDCTIDASSNSQFTATVVGQSGVSGSTVDSTLVLSKASGVFIGSTDMADAQNVTSWYTYIYGTVKGQVTVSTGTVYVYTNNAAAQTGLTVTGEKNSLSVGSGAELAVDKFGNTPMKLTVGKNVDKASVTVDGTVSFDGGVLDLANGIMDVAGTISVGDETEITIAGTMNVTGTLAVSETDGEEGLVTVTGTLVVGVKPASLGAAGSVSGAVEVTTGSIKAYAGSDITGAEINLDASGESTIESTAFYINDGLYMTVYAVDFEINNAYLAAEKFSIVGYDMTDIGTVTNWYTDAGMAETDKVDGAFDVGKYDAVYFKADPAVASIVFSVGPSISLYIDDVRVGSSTEPMQISVGTHTVKATVNPGYAGEVTISFNGKEITGGTFEITPEMSSATYGNVYLSATGNITVDTGSTDDGGMGLTDYLLIILVILILVMAVMVALRLMRS